MKKKKTTTHKKRGAALRSLRNAIEFGKSYPPSKDEQRKLRNWPK